MTVAISRQHLKKWIDHAIDDFKNSDLLDFPEIWVKIFDTLADYLGTAEPADQKLLWMLDGSDDSLPDIIYQLNRMKVALIEQAIKEEALDQIKPISLWFDRTVVVIVEKSTGRMSQERALLQPYETIFWNARDGMYISSMAGKFLQCNEALLKMLKVKDRNELLQMDIRSELYLDQQQRQVMLDHLMKDGFFDQHEFSFRCSDGEIKTALESCYLVQVPNGQQFIVGLMVDITHEKEIRRQAESYVKNIEKTGIEASLALTRETKRYDALLNLNDHPVILVEPKSLQLVDGNLAFCRRFKYGKKQIETLSLRDLFDQENWMELFPQISNALNRQHYHVRDISCLPNPNADFDIFPADLSVLVHQDDQGSRLFIQFEDQGELRNLKSRLEKSRQNLRLAVDAVPTGIIGFKNDGSVAFVNKPLSRITGYPSRKLANISFMNDIFLKEEQRLKFHKYLRQFIRGHHVKNEEVELKSKTGEALIFRLSTVSFRFEDSEKPGFLALLTNITAQVELERVLKEKSRTPGDLKKEFRAQEALVSNLKERLAELERQNRFKQDFLNAFIRKFKIPIHIVLGYADLLSQDQGAHLDEGQKEDVAVIHFHIHLLLNMLERTAEFAQLNAGDFHPLPERVGVRELIQSLFARLEAEQPAGELPVRFFHQILSLDQWIEIDAFVLETILRHLIENARACTKSGEIVVSAQVDQGRLCLEVKDSGVGMGPVDLPQIFEPFFQIDPTGPGTVPPALGLGLAIVKKYVALLNGEIGVNSKIGSGTTFWIKFGGVGE